MIHTLTPNPAIDRLLMVPELHLGAHIQVTQATATPSGKGVNVACYLQAMGEAATAWALVGHREVAWFREVLGAAGIEAGIFPTRGLTRQNLTIVPQDGPETHLREPGQEISPVEWTALADMLTEHMAHGDTLIIAGSVPKGITAAMLMDLVAPLTEKCTVIVDINGPVTAAFFKRARGAWFKGNREETAAVTGGEFSPEALARAVEKHADLPGIIATAAGDEVYAALRLSNGKAAVFQGKPPEVKNARSSVGAGDAFTAGFVKGGLPHDADEGSFAQALRRAVAAGSASLTSPTVGGIDAALVERLFKRVKVNRI